jgi:hypothetical protein
MNEIFAALASVLPDSLDERRFADPARRSAIAASLATLARNADRLQSHAGARDATFAHLSESLARDAREVHRRFEEGHLPEARFLLREMTENCVACHSRIPSERVSDLGKKLFDNAEVSNLPPESRARLQVATRQFDAALDTYEKLFLAADAPLASLDLDGHFTDYLLVAIRVKDDPTRPRATLAVLVVRPDVPHYLRQDFRAWIRALDDLVARPRSGSELEQARALIQAGNAAVEFPSEQTALVQYLAASALLHRYVSSRAHQGEDVAEAYYLLGLTESRTNPFYWLSETEFFLETSIRLAPRAPFAERAYALLEEHTIQGYSGSSGVNVPEDVQQRLDELRSLLEQEKSKGP